MAKQLQLKWQKKAQMLLSMVVKKADVDTIVSEIKEQFPDTNPQGAAYDISQSQQRQELFAAFPKIDILVRGL